MTESCHYGLRLRAALIAVWLLALGIAAAPAWADPYDAGYFFPAGGAQGATLTVSLGQSPRWPVQVFCHSGQITATALEEKGKLQLVVAADAQPGRHWLRLYDEQGASGWMPFVIGTLPELDEVEPNDRLPQAQLLSSSTTINGRLGKAGDVDCFAIALQGGQTLVAAVSANSSLQSPMDCVLQICQLRGVSATSNPGDGESGPRIAEDAEAFVLVQNDDEVGIDPQLVFTAPADGWYLMRVFAFPETPTSTIGFAGGDAMIYRLTATTAGFVDHTLPLAVQREQTTTLDVIGWNLEQTSLSITAPPTASRDPVQVPVPVTAHHGAPPLAVLPHTCLREAEPNEQQQPQPIQVPATISGNIQQPGDVDAFRFAATKGQRLSIEVESRALGLALDGVLRVLDAEGKQLATADDQGGDRDPRLVWTAPADGNYVVAVSDRFQHGGQRFAYRLTLQPEPEFNLRIDRETWELAIGKTLEIPLVLKRRDGIQADIDVVAVDLPPGVVCDPVVSKSESKPEMKLTLRTVEPPPENWQGAIRFEGRAADGQTVHVALCANARGGSPRHLFWLTLRK